MLTVSDFQILIKSCSIECRKDPSTKSEVVHETKFSVCVCVCVCACVCVCVCALTGDSSGPRSRVPSTGTPVCGGQCVCVCVCVCV